MKIKVIFQAILITCFLILGIGINPGLAVPAASGWTSIGQAGIIIHTIAVDPAAPSTLYVGTSGSSAFKSTNGGVNWNPANNGLVNNVSVLAIDPITTSTIYAGTDLGVYKSGNSGGKWVAVNNGLTNHTIHALAINPSSPGTIFAGTGGGVFVSTSGGSSWITANKGLPLFTSVNSLAMSSSGTLYAGTDSGVYLSSGGGTWGAFSNGLPASIVTAVAIDPASPGTIYAGTDIGGAFKSVNGGAWTAINNGLVNRTNPALKCDATSFAFNTSGQTTVFAATLDSGVFASSDNGQTWNEFNTGLTVYDIFVLNSTASMLYAGTFDGTFEHQLQASLPNKVYIPMIHRS